MTQNPSHANIAFHTTQRQLLGRHDPNQFHHSSSVPNQCNHQAAWEPPSRFCPRWGRPAHGAVMKEEIVGAVLPWVVQCYLWHAFTHLDIAIDVVLFWPTFQLNREGWGPSTEFRRQLCPAPQLVWPGPQLKWIWEHSNYVAQTSARQHLFMARRFLSWLPELAAVCRHWYKVVAAWVPVAGPSPKAAESQPGDPEPVMLLPLPEHLHRTHPVKMEILHLRHGSGCADFSDLPQGQWHGWHERRVIQLLTADCEWKYFHMPDGGPVESHQFTLYVTVLDHPRFDNPRWDFERKIIRLDQKETSQVKSIALSTLMRDSWFKTSQVKSNALSTSWFNFTPVRPRLDQSA